MYPTTVIVLVETKRSMMDIYEMSLLNASRPAGLVASEARTANLGSLSIAVGPINSAQDNEAGSPPSCAVQSQDVQERGLEKVILEVNLKESQASG